MAAPQTEVLITVAGCDSAKLTLPPGDYVIGRGADCSIRVEAGQVADTHAKLILNYDHALIEDLGSSGGTRVNGQPVSGTARLWPNQKIQVGLATIELHRLKHEVSDLSLAPAAALVKRVLPEEFLREKKYDIGGVVARGGMAAILDAREATTERTISMKVMLEGHDADALLRFLNEAKITAQLEHPNIVPVHELSVDENGQPYYTMKMVRGVTLKKVLEQMAARNTGILPVRPAGFQPDEPAPRRQDARGPHSLEGRVPPAEGAPRETAHYALRTTPFPRCSPSSRKSAMRSPSRTARA